MSNQSHYEKYSKPYRQTVVGSKSYPVLKRGKRHNYKVRFLCLGKGCSNPAKWQHGDYCSDECRDSVINEVRVLNGKSPR